MPSGAKKRKAAKKKKGNQNQSSNSAHGDEGVMHHEDRESDVGDQVTSPTSEDHQKLPMGGEDEEIEKDNKEQVGVEERVVQVEKEIKIEDELVVKDGIMDHDDDNRKSYDGGSSESSDSSSSSDDESHGIKKGKAESSIALVESVEVAESSIAPVESVEVAESSIAPVESVEVAESSIAPVESVEVAESCIAPVESVEVVDSLSRKSVEPVCDLPTAEAGELIVENISAANSERTTVITRQVELDVLSPADIAVAPYVVESTIEENEGGKCSSVCISEPSMNAASQVKEEANLQCSESTPTTLDPKECVAQENDDRSASPYVTPSQVVVDNGEPQHMKDRVVTEPATFPYQVQKTSWKSCCGLFEVFSGSTA